MSIPERILLAALGAKHSAHPSDISLKSVSDAGSGSSKGDNYSCELKRVKVEFTLRGGEPQEDRLIVKVLPPQGRLRDRMVNVRQKIIWSKRAHRRVGVGVKKAPNKKRKIPPPT